MAHQVKSLFAQTWWLEFEPQNSLRKARSVVGGLPFWLWSREINATWKLLGQLTRSSQRETLTNKVKGDGLASQSCPVTSTHKQGVVCVPRISQTNHTQMITNNDGINNNNYYIFLTKEAQRPSWSSFIRNTVSPVTLGSYHTICVESKTHWQVLDRILLRIIASFYISISYNLI